MFTHRLDDDRWLRLTEESDVDEIYELIVTNRDRLAEWMPWAAAATIDSTRAYVRSSRRGSADIGGFSSVIVERGAIVGSIGVPHVRRDDRSCEVGYWIASAAEGRGTITLAVRALLHHAFGAWELNRAMIQAGVGNVRSRAVPERLGFTLEGVMRQAERYPDGHYIDLAVYGLLASEWREAADQSRR